MERNSSLTYRTCEFDLEKVTRFMQLWERQLVRGQPIQWAYPVGTLEEWWNRGELILFEAVDGDTVAMHFLKKEDGFWEAGPPMWDKANMSDKHTGTYMWFQMVLYGIENKLGVINFGGGIDKWREMLRTRKDYTNPKYKFRFIPREVKQNPEEQPDYEIITQNGIKTLWKHSND